MLPDNTPIWVDIPERQVPGPVSQRANTPRSYLVDTPSGQVCRN